MLLADIVRYLDTYLRPADIRDAPDARNGLQLENAGQVTRVAAAVDLCQATIRLAVAQGADLMLVHHGMLWGEPGPVVGRMYRRVAALVEGGVAVYSSHLPLDLHPEVGNNVELARALGIAVRGAFGASNGVAIGVWGEVDVARAAFEQTLAAALGGPARGLPFGPPRVRRVGVVTGAAGDLIRDAATAGLDTYVTGEGPHWTFFDAEELGVNVYYGGHYRTETFGVKALAAHVGAKFSLPWSFLDHPTGM